MRTTPPAFSPSLPLRLTGATNARNTQGESSSRPTSNSYHDNGSRNGVTALSTVRKGRPGPPTAWDLPLLVRPLPVRRRPCRARPRWLAHYPAIVTYVFQTRFATAHQIQRRFQRHLPSYRTTQYQLANLVQLGHLATASVRSTSPNFPFVYFATGRGVRLVRDTYSKLGLPWSGVATETKRSRGTALASILHELLLSEFDLAVWQSIRARDDLQRLFVERRYFRRENQLTFQHEGRKHRVVPDSGFMLRMTNQTSGRPDARPSLLLHLTELDNGTMAPRRVRKKLEAYDLWSRSPEGLDYLTALYDRYGQSARRPSFRLLVIARANFGLSGDGDRMLDLFAQMLELSSSTRNRLWLTSVEAIRAHQDEPTPLSPALWLRAKDARPWIREYRSLISNLQRTGERKLLHRNRRFLQDRLASLPRHSLFPHQEPGSDAGR